jgi:type II secretory pathway component PulM
MNRTLSDSDVAAIAAQVNASLDLDDLAGRVEARMVERFQLETGKAVWGTVKRWLIKVMIWAALLLVVHQAGVDRHFVDALVKGTR